MQLAMITDPVKGLNLSFTEMLDTAQKKYGINNLEISAGGWQPAPHCDREALLADDGKAKAYLNEFKARGMHLIALNCNGNPLAPNDWGKEQAESIRRTILLAEKLGVHKIVTMSGLPGANPRDVTSNWLATMATPTPFVAGEPYADKSVKETDMAYAYDYEWDVAIKWWTDTVKFAKDHGVNKIAIELFPGMLVYSPEGLWKLRHAVGDVIGANMDPSHLFVMGMEPIACVRALKGAIYHSHGKDAIMQRGIIDTKGLWEQQPVTDIAHRAWFYVAVGAGHSLRYWREFYSVLKMCGYDGPVSLEMEDLSMSIDQGLRESIDTLNQAIIH